MSEPLDLEPIKARNAVGHDIGDELFDDMDYVPAQEDIDALIAEVERLRRVEGGRGFCGNCGERCDYC